LIEQALADRIKLDWQDCLKLDRPETYDAVYSRDVFLHIQDKPRLFRVLNQSLRSGGQLLFTDYCCGPKPWAVDFSDYVEQRGYCLHTLEDYAGLISAAGFEQVTFRDLTDRFVAILESDLATIAKMAVTGDREKLANSWRQKIARAKGGDHRWGLFTARKAS
jgi:phosphoethanolamine N-methyltransferase